MEPSSKRWPSTTESGKLSANSRGQYLPPSGIPPGMEEQEKNLTPGGTTGGSYSLTILAASAHNTPSFPNPFPNREDISPGEHLCFGNPFLSRFALKIPLGFAGQSSSKPRRKSDFPDFLGATLQVQSSSGGTFPYDHPLPWNGGAGGRVGIFPGVKDRASSTHSRTIWVPAVGSRLL